MPERIYVGTGGWYDYKKDSLSPGLRLKAYSKKFNFVEVNSTFYKIIHPKTVERWSRLVPEDFQFSVKCYQALTHKIGIRPVEDAFNTMNTMMHYCRILKAKILVLESPAHVRFDDKFVRDARQFFTSLSMNNVRVAWEFRRKPEELPDELINLMRDLEIIHVVDLSWEEPRRKSDILYTRIFGNPKNEFRLSNQDINIITQKVMQSESRIAYLSTHTPRMMQDAEKFDRMVRSEAIT